MADDGMTEVRVTLFDHPIRVHKSELPSLRSQGLLVEDDPEPASPKETPPPPPAMPVKPPAQGQPSA